MKTGKPEKENDMTVEKLIELLDRDAVDIFSKEGLIERLKEGKPLKIKLGADPSRPDLHLGHSVVLRKLRLFQELGHEIVFIIGDFTGMIGDPSGKSKTRQPLTFEQTRKNGQTYLEQVTKILDPEKTRITYNSEWLGKMNFSDVLSLAGKYTVARIMERDDFAKRFAEKQPIGMHEMFYPLMQGYDSVAIEADVEVGGTDQTFNLLVGRDLQKDYGQRPQEVITFSLLPGLDGVEKMSKSLDNYIGLDEPAEIMFEKCMKVPDTLIMDYFRLTTDLDLEKAQALINENVREAHFVYAREIVRMYHGENAVAPAEKRYHEIAKGGIPNSVETLEISAENAGILDVLVAAGFCSSKGDARRTIQGKGVKLDGEVLLDANAVVASESVVSKGKNNFIKIKIK